MSLSRSFIEYEFTTPTICNSPQHLIAADGSSVFQIYLLDFGQRYPERTERKQSPVEKYNHNLSVERRPNSLLHNHCPLSDHSYNKPIVNLTRSFTKRHSKPIKRFSDKVILNNAHSVDYTSDKSIRMPANSPTQRSSDSEESLYVAQIPEHHSPQPPYEPEQSQAYVIPPKPQKRPVGRPRTREPKCKSQKSGKKRKSRVSQFSSGKRRKYTASRLLTGEVSRAKAVVLDVEDGRTTCVRKVHVKENGDIALAKRLPIVVGVSSDEVERDADVDVKTPPLDELSPEHAYALPPISFNSSSEGESESGDYESGDIGKENAGVRVRNRAPLDPGTTCVENTRGGVGECRRPLTRRSDFSNLRTNPTPSVKSLQRDIADTMTLKPRRVLPPKSGSHTTSVTHDPVLSVPEILVTSEVDMIRSDDISQLSPSSYSTFSSYLSSGFSSSSSSESTSTISSSSSDWSSSPFSPSSNLPYVTNTLIDDILPYKPNCSTAIPVKPTNSRFLSSSTRRDPVTSLPGDTYVNLAEGELISNPLSALSEYVQLALPGGEDTTDTPPVNLLLSPRDLAAVSSDSFDLLMFSDNEDEAGYFKTPPYDIPTTPTALATSSADVADMTNDLFNSPTYIPTTPTNSPTSPTVIPTTPTTLPSAPIDLFAPPTTLTTAIASPSHLSSTLTAPPTSGPTRWLPIVLSGSSGSSFSSRFPSQLPANFLTPQLDDDSPGNRLEASAFKVIVGESNLGTESLDVGEFPVPAAFETSGENTAMHLPVANVNGLAATTSTSDWSLPDNRIQYDAGSERGEYASESDRLSDILTFNLPSETNDSVSRPGATGDIADQAASTSGSYGASVVDQYANPLVDWGREELEELLESPFADDQFRVACLDSDDDDYGLFRFMADDPTP